MSLHKPFDRHFFVVGGNVKTSGGSFTLAKGEIGLFSKQTSVDGSLAVNSLAGFSKSSEFTLKQGISSDVTVSRTISNKNMSSQPFKISDVKNVRVSAPKSTSQKLDEVILGYDGINADSAITFKKGDRKAVVLRLSGEIIGMLGYPDNFVHIEYVMEEEACNPLEKCNECDDCEEVNCTPIVRKAAEHFMNFELRGGVKVSDVIDVIPVNECGTAPEFDETPYQFYSLSVCDRGDDNALALVQAQFPDFKVVKTGRKGSTSTYQLLAPQGTELADYTLSLAAILKDCEDCPEGWTETEGGFLYTLSVLNGDGSDLSTAINDELPEAKIVTPVAKQAQNEAVGFYTVVLNAPLTSAEIADLVAEFSTITVEFVAEASSFCSTDTSVTASWTSGEVCNVSKESYTITLPDDKCGESRLAELQAAYPGATIAINMVEGEDGEVEDRQNCSTRYIMEVVSNLVCEECSEIFKDYFRTTKPAKFDVYDWVKVGEVPAYEDCKCGLRFKAKEQVSYPDEYTRDTFGFIENSTKIEVSGGFITEVREGIGQVTDNTIPTYVVSKWEPRTHVGESMLQWERNSFFYFNGHQVHSDVDARFLLGEFSNIEPSAQYVDYVITVENTKFAQSMSQTYTEVTNYHILVELGKHFAVESMVNMIATKAGLPAVTA
jgi:hypothetical protein